MSKPTVCASRSHDFSAGHKITGHENKCSRLHGHNYRIHFTLERDCGLDSHGRVLDFSVIKDRLCDWLETHWDHRFLIYQDDPDAVWLGMRFPDDIVLTPFNPSAENMAMYLVETIGPSQLVGTDCTLVHCSVEETRKCGASYGRHS